MTAPHTHPCLYCAKPVPCDARWKPNHDGIPQVACPAYHLESGAIAEIWCGECDKGEDEP
jgi:hypothetical protein